ncbi:hypothetical protein ACUW6W_002330, partial [Micrococcus sp. 093350064-1]
EGSLEGSHGDRVREGDGVGDRGGLHHYQGLNWMTAAAAQAVESASVNPLPGSGDQAGQWHSCPRVELMDLRAQPAT